MELGPQNQNRDGFFWGPDSIGSIYGPFGVIPWVKLAPEILGGPLIFYLAPGGSGDLVGNK